MTALDDLWRQGAMRRLTRHLETTPARPVVVVQYRPGQHCPSCGGTAWSIGRETAECGRCGLPLALPATATARAHHVARTRLRATETVS